MAGLKIDREEHVLRVTLARPERRNAFDAALIAELTEAFADVGDARAVVLAGEGQSFCAGADVDWQRSAIDLSYEENVEDALRLYRMCETIDRCPAPVIARVHGYALGGGSGLAACADIAIAAPDAVFGFSEVKLGIIPAVISPFVLPKIGAHARRYFLTGERFDAATALRIGLIEEIADDLDAAVDRVLSELLTAGPEAVREAKRLIRERPAGEETAQIAARLRAGEEGQEGLRAFLEGRSARLPDGTEFGVHRTRKPDRSHGPERQLLAATAGARSHDRIADLRRAIAVLERCAVRCDVAAVGDRLQEVMHLVHEGLSPADDVPRRPPEIHERMVCLRHEHRPEAARAVLAFEIDLQLVQAFHVEGRASRGSR